MASVSVTPAFIPPYPLRPSYDAPVWAGFFGERLRNTLHGIPAAAFVDFTRSRKVLNLQLHVVSQPDAVGRVLLDNKENYIRPRLVQRVLAPVIGNGLLSSEGEDWRKQRKIVSPTFAPGAVAKMIPLLATVAQDQVAGWRGQAPFRLDMAKAATGATMAIIAKALFAGDARLMSAEAGHHIDNLVRAGGQARLSTLLGLSNFDLSKVMRDGRAGSRYLRATLGALVKERGPEGGADDFFGQLIRGLRAQFPAAEAEALAVDNAVTFYVAGHETTSNALAWSIYLLAAQPEVQERAQAEAVAALAGDPGALFEAMPYLRQVLDEAMRLYPPAPRFDREAVADDQLGDLRVRKGDLISIWPWLIHRHQRVWKDPDVFDPERFSPGGKAAMHRHQYLPFGAGPRTCVGARFALMEALIILAHWLAAARFETVRDHRVYPLGSVTLRPEGGMPLLVTPV
jgi:cytochrome P450